MKQVTVHTYRQDNYYPRVMRAVATILARSDVVAPVDVLLEMGNLRPKNHEAWYRGHVPYLERVFAGSLSKANRILRLIGFHVHDLNMVPRRTVYSQGGQSKTAAYGSRSRDTRALKLPMPRTMCGTVPGAEAASHCTVTARTKP
jgi:hypothetical protein